MARYRQVDVRLWSDRKFLSLSNEGRVLWCLLLTAPATLPIPGVILGGEGTLSEQLGWSVEQYRSVFAELTAKGLAVKSEGRLTWLPNALRYQPPRNSNQLTGWAKTWDDVPECSLKREIWESLKIACKSWSKLFARLFAEPVGKQTGELFGVLFAEQKHQEQDQEQDQEQEREEGEQPSRPELPDPEAQKPVAIDAERDRRARADQRVGAFAKLNDLRREIAAEHRLEGVRDLHPFDPGVAELGSRQVECPSLEVAGESIQHVLAIAEAEARGLESVQHLTGALFTRNSWRRALGMTPADARREAEQKRRRRDGPTNGRPEEPVRKSKAL